MASRVIESVIPVLNLTDNIPLQLSLSRSVFRFDSEGNPTPDNQSCAITAHVGQGLNLSQLRWTGSLDNGQVATLDPALRVFGIRRHSVSIGDSGSGDFVISDVRYVPDGIINNAETVLDGVGSRSSLRTAWPVDGGFQVTSRRGQVDEYSVDADGNVAHVASRADIPQDLSPSDNIAAAWYDEDSSTWTVINNDGTIRTKVGNSPTRTHRNFTVSPALVIGLASDDTFLVSTRTAAHLYELQIPNKNITSNTAPVLRTTLTGVPGHQRIGGANFHIGGITRVGTDNYLVLLDGTLWQVRLDSGSWEINQIGSFVGAARHLVGLVRPQSVLIGPRNVRYFLASNMGDAEAATFTATLGQHADSQSLLRVQDGDPAVVVTVTNDTITLTQDNDGSVTNYDGARGTLQVHKGLRLLATSEYSSSMVTSSGITATYDAGTGAYAVTAITDAQNDGTLTFTVSAEGQQYTRVVTVRKGNLGQRAGRNASREIRTAAWDSSQATLAVAENPTTRSVFDDTSANINDGVWWQKADAPIEQSHRTDRVLVMWDASPNSDMVPAVLFADGNPHRMWRVSLFGTPHRDSGKVIINVSSGNNDFTAAREADLRFAFRYKDRTLVVQIEDDFTEPYDFTPDNSAEVIAFVDFVLADADRATQNIDMVILDGSGDTPINFTLLTFPFAPDSGNIISDIVTLYNNDENYAETRTWDGSAWVEFSNRFAGNVLVDHSIVAGKLAANSVTAENIAAHTITASEIRADVLNVDVLWRHEGSQADLDDPDASWRPQITSVTTRNLIAGRDLNDYDIIQVTMLWRASSADNHTVATSAGHRETLLHSTSRRLTFDGDGEASTSINITRPSRGRMGTRIVGGDNLAAEGLAILEVLGIKPPAAT